MPVLLRAEAGRTRSIALFADGGRARALSLRIHRVKSIWE